MLIRLAIVISLLTVACVPVAPVGPVAGGRTRLACVPTEFTNRILVLPQSAQSQLQQPAAAAILTDLGNAYCNASEIFQHRLDNIDFVFLDATQCGGNLSQCQPLNGAQAAQVGWGKRGRARYTEICIAAGLWPWSQGVAQPAEAYANYETDVLTSLMPFSASQPTFSALAGNPANTSWMTVLAAIAHEVGHVRWFEANARSGFKLPYDFKRLTDCAFFLGWLNQTDKSLSPPNRWRGFGNPANENSNYHANPPTFANDYRNATTDQLRGIL